MGDPQQVMTSRCPCATAKGCCLSQTFDSEVGWSLTKLLFHRTTWLQKGLKNAYWQRELYPRGYSGGHKSFPMGQTLANTLQQIYENITML